MIDIGTGPPVVLIPGVQGRWDWMSPAVKALARRCRVLSFSLSGERGTVRHPSLGFDRFVTQLDETLDRAELGSACVCGVSYGGLIGLRYAARRPDRVDSLVLVSTPSPTWRPSCRIEWYLKWPRLLSPAFVAQSPFRLGPEIGAASDGWTSGLRFGAHHVMRVIAAPFSPQRMAERMRLLEHLNFTADCVQVTVPTLVVTGEPRLDKVVSVSSTREFLHAIPHATSATIPRTGHIGLISRPDDFADVVAPFAARHDRLGARPGRVSGWS